MEADKLFQKRAGWILLFFVLGGEVVFNAVRAISVYPMGEISKFTNYYDNVSQEGYCQMSSISDSVCQTHYLSAYQPDQYHPEHKSQPEVHTDSQIYGNYWFP